RDRAGNPRPGADALPGHPHRAFLRRDARRPDRLLGPAPCSGGARTAHGCRPGRRHCPRRRTARRPRCRSDRHCTGQRADRRARGPPRRADPGSCIHGPYLRRLTVSARALVNEFAKMRHLHVVFVAGVLLAVVLGIGLYAGVMNPDFDRTTGTSWTLLLMGLGSGVMISPLLL